MCPATHHHTLPPQPGPQRGHPESHCPPLGHALHWPGHLYLPTAMLASVPGGHAALLPQCHSPPSLPSPGPPPSPASFPPPTLLLSQPPPASPPPAPASPLPILLPFSFTVTNSPHSCSCLCNSFFCAVKILLFYNTFFLNKGTHYFQKLRNHNILLQKLNLGGEKGSQNFR